MDAGMINHGDMNHAIGHIIMNHGDMDHDDVNHDGDMNHGGMNHDDDVNRAGDMNHDDGMMNHVVGDINHGDVNHAGMIMLGFAGHVLRQGVGLLKWVGETIGAPIDEDGQQQHQQERGGGGNAAHQGQGQAEAEGEAEARRAEVAVAAGARPQEEEELLELPPLAGGVVGLRNARREVRVQHRERPEGVPRNVGDGIVGVARAGMAPRSVFVLVIFLAIAFMAGVGVGSYGRGPTLVSSGDESATLQIRYVSYEVRFLGCPQFLLFIFF